MFYGDGFFMGGMHGLWWGFWILLIGVILYFVWSRSDERRRSTRETPRQILQQRLASGEITPEEYETRKALLDRDAGSRA